MARNTTKSSFEELPINCVENGLHDGSPRLDTRIQSPVCFRDISRGRQMVSSNRLIASSETVFARQGNLGPSRFGGPTGVGVFVMMDLLTIVKI